MTRAAALGLAVATLAAAPRAGAAPAPPYRVAIVGDSIVEAPEARARAGVGGLARPLRQALRARKLRADGLGHVAAHGAGGTHTNARHAWPLSYSGPWEFEGEFGGPSSRYGAAGLAAVARHRTADVMAVLRADRIAVLYGTDVDGGRFRFTVGEKTRRIDTAGPSDGGRIAWLPAPDVVDSFRVDDVHGGPVRFLGLVVRRDNDAVELNIVGHSGLRAGDPLSRQNRQALVALHPDLTVLMLGTNDEGRAASGDSNALGEFRRGLALRAQVARRTGRCVIVPHAPNNRPERLQSAFSAAGARIARQNGCAFEPVLADVWPAGDQSRVAGLTADGVHPTPAGYAVMVKRLAALIGRYRRCDARAACPSAWRAPRLPLVPRRRGRRTSDD